MTPTIVKMYSSFDLDNDPETVVFPPISFEETDEHRPFFWDWAPDNENASLIWELMDSGWCGRLYHGCGGETVLETSCTDPLPTDEMRLTAMDKAAEILKRDHPAYLACTGTIITDVAGGPGGSRQQITRRRN